MPRQRASRNSSPSTPRSDLDDAASPPGTRKQSRKPGPGSSKRGRRGKRASRSREYVTGLGDFRVGDDVYVRRVEAGSEESDEEIEECRICGEAGEEVMIECDSCLGGFHLRCLEPPLEAVPEGDWMCGRCENPGETKPAPGTKRSRRTARERFFAGELWAARINKLWAEEDGSFWFSGTWYIIPEETAVGRQPHNGRREIFRTNHVDENEMGSILRQCYVLGHEEFAKAINEGDDVFLCEYEYDVRWHTFKRIADMDEKDEDYASEVSEMSAELDTPRRRRKLTTPNRGSKAKKNRASLTGLPLETPAASTGSLTPFQRAKAALALSTVPGSLPCREKERKEIETFVSEALEEANCLGKCLYISGVPGTGKTATVLEVMRSMEMKVSAGDLKPYRFVEINGLRLTSPEQTYALLHESLTGQRLGWKRALQLLDERFTQPKPSRGFDARPCILLVDELDLLVTRTQSVLYNLFDWPCHLNSRLMVIGIANTMDLPERLLPRIASRMGLQRISFSPYSHSQLQKIISSRLSGIEAFEKTAVEFASRKVAAISGDARRALELCRRAAEIAETRQCSEQLEEGQSLIGMGDIEAAINEMFQAPHIQVMKRCSKHAQIFLVAMVHEHTKTGMAETTFEKVAETHAFLCSSNGQACPDRDTLLAIGCRLGECRLLLCEPGSKHRLQKLQLNFPSDDVSFALRDNPELPWAVKYLPS